MTNFRNSENVVGNEGKQEKMNLRMERKKGVDQAAYVFEEKKAFEHFQDGEGDNSGNLRSVFEFS